MALLIRIFLFKEDIYITKLLINSRSVFLFLSYSGNHNKTNNKIMGLIGAKNKTELRPTN